MAPRDLLWRSSHGAVSLQHRRAQTQNALQRTHWQFSTRTKHNRNLLTILQSIHIILLHIHHRSTVIHPNSILKVQIQAAVIQVDCADHRDLIVTDKRFGVEKSRLILINFHPCLQKLLIVGLGQQKYHLFIWNSRRHNPHVHTTLGGQTESCHHLIVDDQVRRTDIDVMFCPVDDVQIDVLSNYLIIQRCVTIGLDKSISPKTPLGGNDGAGNSENLPLHLSG